MAAGHQGDGHLSGQSTNVEECMSDEVLIQFAITAGLIAALIGVSAVISMLMRRDRKWSVSIMAHIVRVVALCCLVLTVRQMTWLTLDHFKISQIPPNIVNAATALFVSLIIGRELFMLIDRLTHGQIGKGSDPTSAGVVARVLKAIIVLAVILMFGEHFGIGLSGLLAFGGIGGIAIGMASKEILSNIFSGIMLYFDRPFKIGDWVSSPDRQIEGTVQEIGWRITKIMTFDHRPLYVPNSVFSAISVENPGEMSNRRIKTSIGLRYEDAGCLQAVVDDIKTMLLHNEKIDSSQTMLVYFTEFAGSSLNIMVYCFTHTTNWAEWLAAQQEVYLAIVDIVHKHGADFAFPSQTLYFDNSAGVAPNPATPAAPAGQGAYAQRT
jgi:MscS family membrane protein